MSTTTTTTNTTTIEVHSKESGPRGTLLFKGVFDEGETLDMCLADVKAQARTRAIDLDTCVVLVNGAPVTSVSVALAFVAPAPVAPAPVAPAPVVPAPVAPAPVAPAPVAPAPVAPAPVAPAPVAPAPVALAPVAPVTQLTMAQLKSAFPDVFSAPDVATLATSTRVDISAFSALREWAQCAHSGTKPRPLPEKAVKGACIALPLAKRLRDMAPTANSGKGYSLAQWQAVMVEWEILALTAGMPTLRATVEKSELEKARAYIAKLSPETITTLRAEGVI
jgi:hypothetical protein